MADETTNIAETTQQTQQATETAAATAAQTAAEKKYDDNEVNAISKKNSEKAVAKLMKDLGIDDPEKAKAILAKAKAEEPAVAPDPEKDRLAQELRQAQADVEKATVENLLLAEGVNADRVERAARLITRADCLDDSEAFDREKAKAAVKTLLKDWPELKPQTSNTAPGFNVGADMSKGEKDTNAELAKAFGNKI